MRSLPILQGVDAIGPRSRNLSCCEARGMIARLGAIMPEVMVDLPLPYRNPQHRELFLSGLRLALGETT
jgi:hypothetical protein